MNSKRDGDSMNSKCDRDSMNSDRDSIKVIEIV